MLEFTIISDWPTSEILILRFKMCNQYTAVMYSTGCPKKCIHTQNNCPIYLNFLQQSVMPSIREDFEDEEFYFQQDGAPPHYHSDVRSLLDKFLPNTWIGRRGFVEYPPRSPDLTLLDFFL